jgi:hypothetical protein
MIHTRAFAPLILAALFFLGCAPKSQTTLQPPATEPNPQPQLASDARERVKELAARAQEYEQNAKNLPGPNEQADRALLVNQFSLLSQILPALNGPQMSGDFRQQLRIIDSTRAQLASTSQDLSIEPAVDTGLRAAHHALEGIAQRNFTDVPEVNKSLDAMRAKVQELDAVSGPIHRLVAAQAIQASAEAITKMTTALDQRLK